MRTETAISYLRVGGFNMKLKSLAKGLLATSALALALVAAPASTATAEEAQGTYTVEKDDCLRKIAKKVYGDEELWKRIYDANSAVVKSNYIIYKGQVLTIPAASQTASQTPNTAAVTAAPDTAIPQTAAPNTAATATTPNTTTAAPAPETTTPQTTAPGTTTPQTPAPNTAAANSEFVLDYNALASWIDGGFVGTSTSGEAVILATDSTSDYGIIIFADDSTMTAASFVGPITYNNEYMTITDESNGLAITYAVAEAGDGTLVLNLGEYGVATVAAQTPEVMLNFIKLAIDQYTHIA